MMPAEAAVPSAGLGPRQPLDKNCSQPTSTWCCMTTMAPSAWVQLSARPVHTQTAVWGIRTGNMCLERRGVLGLKRCLYGPSKGDFISTQSSGCLRSSSAESRVAYQVHRSGSNTWQQHLTLTLTLTRTLILIGSNTWQQVHMHTIANMDHVPRPRERSSMVCLQIASWPLGAT